MCIVYLGENKHPLPPPPTPSLWCQNLTISFICSIFALIFPDPGFLSPGPCCSRKAEVPKGLNPLSWQLVWQNTEKSCRNHRPLCHKMLPESRSSDERRYPRKLTLEIKAAGNEYLSFRGINLVLKHLFRVEFKRSALHVVQAPAMFSLVPYQSTDRVVTGYPSTGCS